jgi:hypothetical protein
MATPAPFVPPTPGEGKIMKEEKIMKAIAPVKEAPAKKEIPATSSKVIGAKIVLTYLGSDGNTYLAETDVDPKEFKISSYGLTIDEKHEKYKDKESGDLLGFEDTGERVLTFKLRYHVR